MENQIPKIKSQNPKAWLGWLSGLFIEWMSGKNEPEDLGVRTERFAADVRTFLKKLPRGIANFEDAKQLARASGSVAANWIEADEGFTPKDKLFRFKICRKESKESALWLRLLDPGEALSSRKELLEESRQLVLIFSSIIRKLDQ